MSIPIISYVSVIYQSAKFYMYCRKQIRQKKSNIIIIKKAVKIELEDIEGKKAFINKDYTIKVQNKSYNKHCEIISCDPKKGSVNNFKAISENKELEFIEKTTDGKHRFLISLPKSLNKGDQINISCSCELRNSFTEEEENWIQKGHYPIKKSALEIIFPNKRLPKSIWSQDYKESEYHERSNGVIIEESNGRETTSYHCSIHNSHIDDHKEFRWLW